jgi:hypothetical protein
VIIEQELDDRVQNLFFLTGTARDAMAAHKRVPDATPTVLNFKIGHPTLIRQGALFS